MKENTLCLLCGQNAILSTKQKGYQEPDVFDIYCCESCNTSFSLPRVNTSSIYQLIYESGEMVPGYDRYWKYQKEIRKENNPIEYLVDSEPCYWGVYQAMTTNLRLLKEAKILEVGSGLGYLTYSLYKAGYHSIKGLDISQEAVDKAIDVLGNYYVCADIYQYAEDNKAMFDAILLTEVIEHVENPLNFIEALCKLLKKGGSIIMTTPNKTFYPISYKWYTEAPPVHCWWFSEESFEYISKKQSLALEFIDFHQYYKDHIKILFDVKKHNNCSGSHRFDKNGKLIDIIENSNSDFAVLPLWIKRSLFYKKVSRYIYPFFSKRYIVSNHRTNIICAIFTK